MKNSLNSTSRWWFNIIALQFCFCLIHSSVATAESMIPLIDINDLRTPVAPAFVLLGVEPTSIDQPKTPKAFVVSLLNAQTHNFLPQNYALEVAPYWLAPHFSLTFDDYYNANLLQTLLQTAFFSMATSKMPGLDSLSIGTSTGLGLNMMMVQGKANPILSTLRDSLITIEDSIINTPIDDTIAINSLMNQGKKVALEIQKLDKKRIGFRLECAGATIVDFPVDKFDNGKMTRYGVWFLPAYQLTNPSFDFIALGRYIHNESDSTENYLDFGGRIVWTQTDFSLSGEYVYRFIKSENSQSEYTYRVNGNVEYQLNPNIQVTVSFGKNFTMGGSDLIAYLGVNFGFGQIPIVKL